MARLYLLARRNLVRDALQTVLASAGHAVVGADGDATVALAELAELKPDLLLADLRWGLGPTATVLQALVARGAGLPSVLLLPERPTRADEAAWQQLPATAVADWLGSDLSRQALLAALAAALAGHRQEPPWRRPGRAAAPVLSALERRVLQDAAAGRSITRIASSIGLPAREVGSCRRDAMAKLGLADNAMLARYALRQGWMDSDV